MPVLQFPPLVFIDPINITPSLTDLMSGIQECFLNFGDRDINHTTVTLCQIRGTSCHHLPGKPFQSIMESAATLGITCLYMPAPVTAQLKQTECLCYLLNSGTWL